MPPSPDESPVALSVRGVPRRLARGSDLQRGRRGHGRGLRPGPVTVTVLPAAGARVSVAVIVVALAAWPGSGSPGQLP
jgi:hypothetical protein